MAKYDGEKLAFALCEALDLRPDNICELNISCKAGQVATVTITRYLDTADDMEKIFEKYELKERG